MKHHLRKSSYVNKNLFDFLLYGETTAKAIVDSTYSAVISLDKDYYGILDYRLKQVRNFSESFPKRTIVRTMKKGEFY